MGKETMEKQNSAPFIDNVNRNMFEALTDALKNSDRVDIAVGYFFFSGFKALAESFKDKKIRILVGKEIDPSCVPDIIKYSKVNDESLEKWAPRKPTNSALQLKQNYVDALVEFVNNSDTFDEEASENAFKMFAEKIANGSLEIKVTKRDNPYHGKLYLLHNKPDIQLQKKLPGTVIVGSSNLTWSGLIGQGELNKELTSEKDFEEANKIFLDLWDSSEAITVADLSCADEFLATI